MPSLLFLLLAAFAPPLQEAPPVDPPLRVYLWTMDQGDEVYELFGHNALVIENTVTGESYAWNWGLFNFEDVDFIPRFLRGTMRYSMGPAYTDEFLAAYIRADRSVYRNEIALTDRQARELDTFVRWNYLPENRPYIYDYFRDNCSTRVRDALDRVLGGVLQPHFAGRATDRSYRWHSRRLVQVTPWVDQGLSFLLGTRGDPPVSEWEAMFVPMELMRHLEGFEVFDAEGRPRPLLGPREILFQSSRPPTPAEAPSFSFLWLLAGIGAGGAVLFLARIEGSRVARLGFVGAVTAWGTFAGLLGALLVSAWFTDHVFIHWNGNVLYTSPLALLLPPLAILGLFGESGAARAGRRWGARIGIFVAGGSVLALLAQLTRLIEQGNLEVIAMAVPLNLAVAFGLLVRNRKPAEARWAEAARRHDASADRVIEAALAVPAHAWHTPRAEGKWSPEEVMHHLVLGYEVLAGELAGGPGMRLKTRGWQRFLLYFTYRRQILAGKGFPSGAKAPKEVRPAPRREAPDAPEGAREATLARFRASRESFVQALEEARRTRPKATVTNAYFGALSLEEAYRFVAHHLDHHRPQLRIG